MNYKLKLVDNIANISLVGDISEQYKEALKEIKSTVVIPGFRRGSSAISDEVVIDRYRETIESKVIDKFLTEHYTAIVKKNKLDILGQPSLKDVKFEKDTLKAEISVELFPQMKLAKYKDLNIKRDDIKVNDDEVMEALKYIANKNSQTKVSKKPAKMGDLVTIDFEGFLNSVSFDGGKADNYDLRLGSRTFIDNFEEQIVGYNVGDKFDVNVKFPENYRMENLKGQNANFKVEIKKIQQVIVAKIDDKLAKKENFNSVEELKENLRLKLIDRRERDSNEQIFNKIISDVTAATEMKLPKILLDKEMKSKELTFKQKNGRELSDTEKKQIEDNTSIELKEMLVIREILKIENITVTDKEVKDQVVKKFNMKYEDVLSSGNSDRFINELISNIRIEKIKKFILSNNVNKS